MFLVKRPINEISINGDEYLLKEDGTLWEFKSKAQAKRILTQHGIDISNVDIVENTTGEQDE